ncbi:hypothetical protein PaG_00461 [Moesziomyces aphidis]|uniref:Uncharacterized protein n=1 Tax=Moesziomyces aphidis TaxID=84754 RepID=W3VW51_MOEAP|nr:hypothetical protein PaG_00461 [Moesziomyces aphidis]
MRSNTTSNVHGCAADSVQLGCSRSDAGEGAKEAWELRCDDVAERLRAAEPVRVAFEAAGAVSIRSARVLACERSQELVCSSKATAAAANPNSIRRSSPNPRKEEASRADMRVELLCPSARGRRGTLKLKSSDWQGQEGRKTEEEAAAAAAANQR